MTERAGLHCRGDRSAPVAGVCSTTVLAWTAPSNSGIPTTAIHPVTSDKQETSLARRDHKSQSSVTGHETTSQGRPTFMQSDLKVLKFTHKNR